MALPPSPWPARLLDQSFGVCITPNDFFFPFYNTYNTNYYRPWKWCMQDDVKDFGSTIDNDKDYFKIILDVQHFRPKEISVKVLNNQVLVEGKHEERKDEHGFVARQFTRRYALPSDCKPEDVESNLSSDGVLIVSAKKSAVELKVCEKVVPIQLSKTCSAKEEENVEIKTTTTEQQTQNREQERSEESMKVDTFKNNTQIMLKEDHCCLLLKPELLREAASENIEIKSENKKEKVEKEQVKSQEQVTKNTSEMLEQSFGKCSVAVSKSAEISEETCLSSEATASSSEKAGQSSMIKAQISELTGISSMSSECIESSSSYKSSMTSNTCIQEISEELSDFVSDILCSELDITQDTKKL